MNITLDNYEQFFLDHAEGNLSREMEKELTDFLEANPDLKPVLEDFDPSPLQTGEMRNEIPKAGLKRHLHLTDHIREDNVDEWMIRDVEGLLDESETNELEEFLALNPPYNFDYKIFGYTKLTPDLSVSYRQKKELKKKVVYFPIRRLVWLLPAAAAIILLFIGIRFLLKPETDSVLYLNTPDIQAVVKIPESHTPDIVTPSAETLSHRTPSETSSHEVAASFRIMPYATIEVVQLNPSGLSQINLKVYDISPDPRYEKKDKPLIAKVFSNMVAQAREGISNRTNLDKARKTDFNIWSIAKAGINGYNSISDRELELYVHKDEDGKVNSYALVDQQRLILSKELNKN